LKTDAGRPFLYRLVSKCYFLQSLKRCFPRPLVCRLVPTRIGTFGSKIGAKAKPSLFLRDRQGAGRVFNAVAFLSQRDVSPCRRKRVLCKICLLEGDTRSWPQSTKCRKTENNRPRRAPHASPGLGLVASTAFHDHLSQGRRHRDMDIPYHNFIPRFVNRTAADT